MIFSNYNSTLGVHFVPRPD